MKAIKTSKLFLILPFMILGCGSGETNSPAVLDEKSVTGVIQREMNPNATEDEILEVKQANNKFSMDLYKQIKVENESFFSSSYTTFTMLNMLWEGAFSETKNQMKETLNISLEENNWHSALNALDLSFSRVSDSFDLEIANALWVQDGMTLKEEFETTLKTHYGTKIKKIDFSGESEKSRLAINTWTKQTTQGKIEDLLVEGSVSENTKLIATNAIHLKAKWQKKFSPSNTEEGDFVLLDESRVKTPMMYQKNSFRHTTINGVELLYMSYNDSDFRLLSMMPPKGEFEVFEETMSEEIFLEMVAHMPEVEEVIELTYPKFEFETSLVLNDYLKNLGMRDAFESYADFSNMSSDFDARIAQIVQKTFLKIDEDGTEATSVTGAVIGSTSVAEKKLVFNRPFLFALCHAPTKTVLFLGRMMNPVSK